MKKKETKEKNTNKNKIILILAPIIILGCIIFTIMTIINNNKKESEQFKIDGLDVISNEKVFKDITAGNLKITDQLVVNSDNMSTYYATVTNTGSTNYHIDYLYVVITVDGEDIKSLARYNSDIAPNQTVDINISFDRDISKATKIEYKLENEEVQN